MNAVYTWYTMHATIGKPAGTAIYVTAQDRKGGRSKTITVRGVGFTPESVLEALALGLARKRRKRPD